LFIIGHWRSGTTLLHNMITIDPSSGYITNYHSLFPNNLASKWLFRTYMKLFMPDKRPSDGVELNVDFPQEDEFAFSNCQPNSYYNFFFFPSGYKTFYEKSVELRNLTKNETDLWYSFYDKLLKKALIDTKDERVIIKNPVNTARIVHLLKLYPDAKFLFLYRNPISVFQSTQRFFQKLYPTIWLHKVDNQFVDSMIFDVYNRLISGYLEQRSLIPPENLMELSFEEFEQKPLELMERIYNNLLKEDFTIVKQFFSDYLLSRKGHKKTSLL
jgi:omega-hydroxy-beta-dihydromenaquinone-9 sulfotransferase